MIEQAKVEVAPLRALRFAEGVDSLGQVWAPPYDVIGTDYAAELRDRHPRNVVRLILPSGTGKKRYAEAARTLREWIAEGTLVRDQRPHFYVHRHEFELNGEKRARAGVWALLRLLPLDSGLVLPHERTMKGPKADRLELMRACRAHLSGIFFICSDPEGAVGRTIDEQTAGEAIDRAEFPAGEHHRIWRVDDADAIKRMGTLMSEQVLLIADGHHRYETGLAYRDELISQGAPPEGRGEHQFILAYIVPEADPGLSLEPTHRLIANEQIDWRKAVDELDGRFRIRRLSEAEVSEPAELLEAQKGRPSFVFLVKEEEGGWLMEPDAELTEIPAVALHELFLDSLPGWSGEGLEGRVRFSRDPAEALREVRSGSAGAAALLAPSAVGQIRDAALGGQRLPPKTTYFWPKVPTGVAIHLIDPQAEVEPL